MEAPLHFQTALTHFNRHRLSPALAQGDWSSELDREVTFRRWEAEWVERERASIEPLVAQVPTEAEPFMRWFEALKEVGPGQGDPLFPFLAEEATTDQLRWFLYQEVAGEAGFDDLVALTQIRLPVRAKLELARNYWDEMGRGHEKGMHGPMLERLASELKLSPQPENVVEEALALGNMMVALASNRRYAYQSLGALGAVELTAPTRAAYVARGLERVQVSLMGRQYFRLHAVLDVKHSEAWNQEVLAPLIAAHPELARPLAEGALLRLTAGARCFERYRRELGLFQGLAANEGTARPLRLRQGVQIHTGVGI
jgi:hypothetical protein